MEGHPAVWFIRDSSTQAVGGLGSYCSQGGDNSDKRGRVVINECCHYTKKKLGEPGLAQSVERATWISGL